MLSSSWTILLTCFVMVAQPGASTIVIRADAGMFCYVRLKCTQHGKWVALNFERFCLVEKQPEGCCTTPEAKRRATQTNPGRPRNKPARIFYEMLMYHNCSRVAVRVHPGSYMVVHSLNRQLSPQPAFLMSSALTVGAGQTLEIQCNQTGIATSRLPNDLSIMKALGEDDVLLELGEDDVLPEPDRE